MQLDLTGKIVVVTGGTKGIGRAIVEGFISEGANVFFCARTKEDVDVANRGLATLNTTGSGKGYVVDICSKSDIERWISEIVTGLGGIDVLVSNVSSLSMGNTSETWTTAFNTDMLGAVNLVNTALPYLEKNRGNIISISSVSGRDIDFTAVGPYGAFKASLVHYVAQLAQKLAPKGIRANTVSPGNIFIEDGVWDGIKKENPELFDSQLKKNPMGRMGKAKEVADAVLFLASERASFISGTNLVVDGALCTGVQL